MTESFRAKSDVFREKIHDLLRFLRYVSEFGDGDYRVGHAAISKSVTLLRNDI